MLAEEQGGPFQLRSLKPQKNSDSAVPNLGSGVPSAASAGCARDSRPEAGALPPP